MDRLTIFSIVKLFNRDPDTNEVLWFAAPPLNMARSKGPRYSLAYLQILVAKRKREDANQTTGDGDGKDAGGEMSLRRSVRGGFAIPRV
jgi:chromatin structure-remodeling complex subunit RSC1/2